MSVTGKAYGLAQQSLANKEIDWDTDTIKVMLCSSSYTPNQDTHRYKSDVTNEITGTGYTAGGTTLTSKTVTYSSSGHTVTLSAASPSWTTASFTARYAVFYSSTGTDSTSALIGYWDFGGDSTVTGGTFTLNAPSSGFVTLSTS